MFNAGHFRIIKLMPLKLQQQHKKHTQPLCDTLSVSPLSVHARVHHLIIVKYTEYIANI